MCHERLREGERFRKEQEKLTTGERRFQQALEFGASFLVAINDLNKQQAQRHAEKTKILSSISKALYGILAELEFSNDKKFGDDLPRHKRITNSNKKGGSS